MNRPHRVVLGLCLAIGLSVQGAAADPVAEAYKGKTLTIVVGHEVGTGFDIYSRLLARHIGRHVPGNPNVVVQNMIGASGLTSANWLYNIAPKDGTVMLNFVQSVPFEPLYGNAAARFDPAKFNWIGNLEESVGICGVTKASGIATFDDLRAKETIFAATGAAGPLAKHSLAIKNLLGAKVKLVSGYQGAASIKLAMQRGEVHGICGLTMSAVMSFWKDDYESGSFKPVIQLSGKRQPQLGAHVDDFAKSKEDRQVQDLIFGTLALGRLYVAPPAVPTERVEALRAALMATANDPAFLDDAVRTQVEISPTTAAEVESFIARIAALPPDVVERAKRATSPD